MPTVSVVLPARNVAPFIDEAVGSILSQTFGDFELVVRDDGSTDGTTDKLRRWAQKDRRIKLFIGERSLGLAGSSNWVVARARAPIVARMDGDDVAMPDRLARQFELLRQAPDVCLIGSLWQTIDQAGRPVRGAEPWRIVRRSAFAPFPHSSIMFRRDAFYAVGGYRPQCEYWEDLDLYLRLSRRGAAAVIAEPLVKVRLSPLSARKVVEPERVEMAMSRMYESVEAVQQGADYEPLLARPVAETERVHPFLLVSLGTQSLWLGKGPRIFGRMLRRARLRADAASLLSLSWAALAALSPAALRALSSARIAVLNRRARRRTTFAGAYLWKPHGIRRRPARAEQLRVPWSGSAQA